MLVVGPYAWRRKLDQMVVEIAKIEALAATRPFDAALNFDASLPEPFFPSRKVLGRYGEGKMQVATPIMRRDHTAGQLHGFPSATAAKQDQDITAANVEGAEAFVGSEAREAEKALIEMR